MAKLTPEQRKGKRFEIVLEEIFNRHYRKVERDLVLRRSQYQRRQVDLMLYDYNLLNSKIIVEAKYLSKGNVRYKLRKTQRKTGSRIVTIENLLEEVEERRVFVKARGAIIATNQGFDKHTYAAIDEFPKITLYDGNKLAELNQQLWYEFLRGVSTIDKMYKEVNLNKHRVDPIRRKI